ncbi:sensor histidine kinase [Candidatus Bipolaricaulota bacterium]|nr:sensor histidine kinase [Candidatus Bipolaricaulota bacterium]
MIEELDMHILDLVQNAMTAQSSRIDITLDRDTFVDVLKLQVRDNGRGMDEQTRHRVERGFYSTKCPKCVGLGIPLLRETAEHCDGTFSLRSHSGEGTTITATFRASHIDLPPFGNLEATFLDIVATSGHTRVCIDYRDDGHSFKLDTQQIREMLGDVPMQHPDVIRFLHDFLADRIGGTHET